eukprot:superscaffoldBa00012234_g25579
MYSSTQICAFKGSTVDINCTYIYPSRINDHDTEIKETIWFTKGPNYDPVNLRTDSEYSGRFQYHCDENDCTLTITDLRESDSAEYKFRFITNDPGGKYTGSPGVTLTVIAGVMYSSTQICAFKGSTVDINCTYRYPSRINDHDTEIKETIWFTKGPNNDPVNLRTDSEYSGRVQYHCDENDCTLRITDLRESDSAEYKFRFITNDPGGKYTGSPGVTLTVT